MRWIIIIICVIISLCIESSSCAQEANRDLEFIYQAEGKRDPFIPLVAAGMRMVEGLGMVETIEDLTLEGIVFDPGGNSVAIINGVILTEGGVVNNLRIKKIEADNVQLYLNEMEYRLHLIKEGGEENEI
ncbi:MAG: hypothetical protein HQ593_02775 [Candidatus Omnitrophica bacterium]|nr:hypothetical protein [Candidatus Omnitrophota bacterium]